MAGSNSNYFVKITPPPAARNYEEYQEKMQQEELKRERQELANMDCRSRPRKPIPIKFGICPTCGALVNNTYPACQECFQMLDWD